jgi:protein TonB
MRPAPIRGQAIGLLVVGLMHAAALWSLWQHRILAPPVEVTTLFVNFISPPPPAKLAEPKRPPPKAIERSPPRQIVADAPVLAPTDYVAPPPPPTPQATSTAPPLPLPSGPVALSSELSVACTERPAPAYPKQSRRLGEAGIVVLRVELDEHGHVAAAKVDTSSGYVRLDDAALGAVRAWRCKPATRNGQPVHAVALQPFNFILQGN